MKRNNDELYTPPCLVKVLLKYIDPKIIIWCPFDTEKSEFVILLKEQGNRVIHSHIADDNNFLNFLPKEKFDCIISNPPFSIKLKVLKRVFSFNKPFALLLGLPILNYQEIGEFFYYHPGLQLLIVDKKVSFNGKTASFNNSFFCRDLLPKDLIFEHLENNNQGKYFIPSRMYESKIESIKKTRRFF